MIPAAKYVKIVEWSEQDNCFVGSCPELFDGGCHGEDDKSVFAELCDIVYETIEVYETEGKPWPRITSGHNWANTLAKVTATS